MKKGYIPQEERKKILLLSDDMRLHSGIGTMAKEIIILPIILIGLIWELL